MRRRECRESSGGPILRQAAGAAPAAARQAASARKEAAAPARGGAKQGDAFDELAFLRSVTEDESHGPAPGRAGAAARAVEEPVKEDSVPRTGKSAKSLKCKECGTMNLPTEWYCERCGAELAAL